jgi:hypothetical protein
VASASFDPGTGRDGWQYRNEILAHLRRIVPHDLRRTHPARTAMLMLCREGSLDWTKQDGSWMWGLWDASALHGLRCGAYLALTPEGWQVLGDGRSGRNPHVGSTGHNSVHSPAPRPGNLPRPRNLQARKALPSAPKRPAEGIRPTAAR